MHDTDTFARMLVGSIAGPPPLEERLHTFDAERDVTFKGEVYTVRDNGAVLRHARPHARHRKLDNIWTFGSPNKQSGYLAVCDHVVHRIVATAFLGPSPSSDHVVDHIDTNRHNNRPENLRWLTRLENVLLNPITRARIESAYGSLEAFFDNPGAHSVHNWEWMRAVTKEEAAQSLARLRKWAVGGKALLGGTLGDWLFAPRDESVPEPEPEPLEIPSLTPGAFQRKWRTPTEFLQCPAVTDGHALQGYFARLTFGSVFARNQFGESLVVQAKIGRNDTLSVLSNTQTGVKSWTLVTVTVEARRFCHASGGAFFTLQGALKAYCASIGEPFDDSIDDHA